MTVKTNIIRLLILGLAIAGTAIGQPTFMLTQLRVRCVRMTPSCGWELTERCSANPSIRRPALLSAISTRTGSRTVRPAREEPTSGSSLASIQEARPSETPFWYFIALSNAGRRIDGFAEHLSVSSHPHDGVIRTQRTRKLRQHKGWLADSSPGDCQA